MGEFSHKIEGKSVAPGACEHVKWTTKANSPIKKLIPLVHQSGMREKAILMAYALSDKDRNLMPIPGRKYLATMDDMSKKEIDRELYQLPKTPLRYHVSYSSPYFDGPSEITIFPPAVQKIRDRRFNMIPFEQKLAELPVAFSPKVLNTNCYI